MKCDNCGKEIQGKIRDTKHHFCNQKCYNEWKTGKKMCIKCRHYFPKHQLNNSWPGYVCKKCRGVPKWRDMKQLSV